MFQVMGICVMNEAIQGFCHPKMALNFIIELTVNIVRYFILGTTPTSLQNATPIYVKTSIYRKIPKELLPISYRTWAYVS